MEHVRCKGYGEPAAHVLMAKPPAGSTSIPRMDWLQDSFTRSVLLPLLTAFAAVGAIRLFWGPSRGAAVASAATPAGFILAFASLGVSVVPPGRGSLGIVVYIAVAGLIVGAILDSEGIRDGARRTVVMALGLAGVAWVGWPPAFGLPAIRDSDILIALVVAALLVGYRITRLSGSASTVPIQLMVASLGLAGIAWAGASNELALIGVALASATFAFVLWNWPVYRFPPGAALVAGIGAPISALGTYTVLFTHSSRLALGTLLLVFFSEWLASGIYLGSAKLGLALRPIITTLAALLVAAVATLIAYVRGGSTFPF